MNRISAGIFLLSLPLASLVHGQISVIVDPPEVSRVMDDFNDGVDTQEGFFNASSSGEVGGIASVLVPANAADPQVQFPNSGEPFDITKYPFFRISSRSELGGAGQVFPLPPSGATVVSFQTGTAFAESQLAFVADPPGADGTGVRLDPVPGGGATAETFDYDYLILDKFETIGLAEYDRDGGTEGFAVVGNGHISGVQVSAASSSLTASTSGIDPIMQRTGLAVDTSIYTVLEIRAAFDPLSSSRFEVFWGTSTNPGPVGGQSLIVTGDLIRDGEMHTYRFRMSDDARWSGMLQVLRIDPLADGDAAAGRSFGIDYVRLIADAPVVDSDFDGLPDAVESGDGVFVDGCATGTDPEVADTDGDGFDDGVEVRTGTDPNDADSTPGGILEGYADAPVLYGLGAPIVPNEPLTDLGIATGFRVSPDLPGGLELDPVTGVITGTPTELSAAADYTITASFANSPESSFVLNIEIGNPFIANYTLSPAQYQRGSDAGFNDPVLRGALPNLFTVEPPLPAGLSLDPNDGSISGIPTGFQEAADYMITAGYDGFPDASFTLSIAVRAVPILVVDPAQSLNSYVSLGEFDADGDLEQWASGNADLLVAGGVLVVNTTAGDPQVFRGGLNLDTSGGVNSVLEFRLRQPDDLFVEFFWGDGSGGLSAVRRVGIESVDIPNDGQFHVYQIDMTGVFSGAVAVIRLDPGPGAGRTVEFDYVRLGSFTAVAPPRLTSIIHDGELGEATVSWTSSPGETFRVEVSTDLIDWQPLDSAYPAAAVGDTTSFLDVAADISPDGFYRVIRVGN